MGKNKNYGNVLVMLLVIGIVSFCVGGFLWPYAINSWLTYFGKHPGIVFWQGGLIGLTPYLGQISIPVAILTWILMQFLV